MRIPFNKPYMTGSELDYIKQAYRDRHLSGDGPFTQKCQQWLEKNIKTKKALLTHSCTAALEMAAILINTQPGDEIIMPSYTFVSTANAFVLRGAVPVFVDIRPDTLNIDETKIEAAITPKTKAIVPVHYAGVGCEMDAILSIADKYHLYVIEDAAQAILSTYKGQPLGSMGHLAALSFHETKNIIAGEGGALLINDEKFIERAEIIREKGTDRSRFFRGTVDKYTWLDMGSSYLPSEVTAAFLWAQMERAEEITNNRMQIWQNYHKALQALEEKALLRRPILPTTCHYNAHMYYILVNSLTTRNHILTEMQKKNIDAISHYVPLHTSPCGKKIARTQDKLFFTESLAEKLIRLPMFIGLDPKMIEMIVAAIPIANETAVN